jgi:hypothetical protein
MQAVRYLALCLAFLFLLSCGKDDPQPQTTSPTGEAAIVDIQVSNTVANNQSQQIKVTIQKPTPCHVIAETKVTSSGTTVNYDFILQEYDGACIQVIAEEEVQVSFAPQASGVYRLNFFINGKLYKTEQVVVTD